MSVYLGTNLVSILGGTKNINGDISLQDKEIDPTESIQYVTADSSYDGLNTVQVNAISSTYIGSGIKKKNAATYTPNNTIQTIASGQYLSGTQTIEAVPTETKTIDSNGTYTPSTGLYFSSVTVAVPDPSLQEKTVSPSETIQDVSPDDGYYGLSKVTVDAISSSYVGSSIPQRTSSDLTASGATVSVPSGYYSTDSSMSVNSTSQATPSIDVNSTGLITASSTQSAGYVSAGTKTATKQLATKSAATYTPNDTVQTIPSATYLIGDQTISAVPTETKTVTSNGTYTPTNGKYFNSVTVNVPTGSGSSAVLGTKTITSNGTYNASSDDLDGYSSVTVNVPGKTFTTQEKSVSPTESSQVIAPDTGYDGLSQVTVSAISTTYVGSGISQRSSADLTVSGDTVTVPSGYYSEDSTKSVATASLATPSISIDAAGLITATENQTESGYINAEVKTATKQMTVKGATTYTPGNTAQTIAAETYLTGVQTISAVSTESKTISPSTSEQIVSPSTGKYLSSVTVEAIPTVTQATPSISVSASGLITSSATQTEGYVVGGTKSATKQLTTKGETTYTPGDTAQTIASGTYLTGTQTISAVATETKTVSPTTSEQTVTPSSGKYLSSVTVDAVSTATQATPSISVSTSGLITATSTQSEGYVSAGTKTATSQLSTLGSTSYTPTTSDQTISSGVYLTGNQTIKGDSNLVGENIISGTSIFGVAGTVVIQKYYTGSEAPSSSLGNDGDIYLQI